MPRDLITEPLTGAEALALIADTDATPDNDDAAFAFARGALTEGLGWLRSATDRFEAEMHRITFGEDEPRSEPEMFGLARADVFWLCNIAWTQLPEARAWQIHPSVIEAWAKMRDGAARLPSLYVEPSATIVGPMHVAIGALAPLQLVKVREHLCREVIGKPAPDDDTINALSIAINERADALLAAINRGNGAGVCIEALTSALDDIGDQGKANAAIIRGKGVSWRPWLGRIDKGAPAYPVAALALTEALWIDAIKARQAERKRKRAALPRVTVADNLLPMMERQQGFAEMDDGVIRAGRKRVASIELADGVSLERVRNGVHLLGSVHGHRLVRTLVHRAHDQWTDGHHDPRRVVFSGGWRALGDAVGFTRKDTAILKDITAAGACVVWDTGIAKGGGLWGWTERRGGRGRPGEVAITLLDPLTPGIAAELASGDKAQSRHSRTARRLVPELRYDVPVGGQRPNEHGPIFTMGRRLMVELVDRAEELAKRGAVIITPDQWREMARKAGVPTGIIPRVLDAWADGDSDEAPALVERDGDAWTLAEPHAPERDFIIEGGKRRGRGRARGKKSARKRAATKRA